MKIEYAGGLYMAVIFCYNISIVKVTRNKRYVSKVIITYHSISKGRCVQHLFFFCHITGEQIRIERLILCSNIPSL